MQLGSVRSRAARAPIRGSCGAFLALAAVLLGVARLVGCVLDDRDLVMIGEDSISFIFRRTKPTSSCRPGSLRRGLALLQLTA